MVLIENLCLCPLLWFLLPASLPPSCCLCPLMCPVGFGAAFLLTHFLLIPVWAGPSQSLWG